MIMQIKHYILRHFGDKSGEQVDEIHYCEYLKKNIDEGLCYDIQMILGEYISPSALPDIEVDRTAAYLCCTSCKHKIGR